MGLFIGKIHTGFAVQMLKVKIRSEQSYVDMIHVVGGNVTSIIKSYKCTNVWAAACFR